MRKKRTVALILTVFALVMVAVPAAAKKPDKPGKPDRDPIAGVTCSSPWWEGDVKYDDFTIILDRDNPDACVDVITDTPGRWYVTVTGSGARQLTIVPRDAVGPGDSCGGVGLRGDAIYEGPIPLPYPGDPRGFVEIPAATVNACPGNADPDGPNPDGEFAELVERDLDGDGAVDETEVVLVRTNEVHPLALQVFSTGLKKAGAQLVIEVDLP